MRLSSGEKITEGVLYKIEFTKAEEVAEMGEHAEKKIVSLPHKFKMNDEKMKSQLFEKAKHIMQEENFDTMVIKKETYEEFLYFKDED